MTAKLELTEWARQSGDDVRRHLLMRVGFEDRSVAIINTFDPSRWQSLASMVTQQSTLMASLDFFFMIGCIGCCGVLLSLVQRRFR